jgi:hypothetical protein
MVCNDNPIIFNLAKIKNKYYIACYYNNIHFNHDLCRVYGYYRGEAINVSLSETFDNKYLLHGDGWRFFPNELVNYTYCIYNESFCLSNTKCYLSNLNEKISKSYYSMNKQIISNDVSSNMYWQIIEV